MKFRTKIALAVFFVFAVFLLGFGALLTVVNTSMSLKELKNQTTQLLADMYRLDFEVKSIMTATAITTPELARSLTATIAQFQATLDLVDAQSRRLMHTPRLAAKIKNAQALWNSTRIDLGRALGHLESLSGLGIDRRTGLISRMQYSYLLPGQSPDSGKERYHLLSLENAIESFAAASFSFAQVVSGLSSEIATAVDESIRSSILVSIGTILLVVAGSLVFFFLFSHQALVIQLDRLLEDAVRKEVTMREAQLQALRYQINPHFLYNTLGSIRAVAVESGQDRLAEMLRVLSRLLRNTISRSDPMTSVEAELKTLEDYLAILQIRYKNRISIEFCIESATKALAMPGLLLQPLVENAVLHGLSERLNAGDQDARLRIWSSVRRGSLLLGIRDNGAGMDEAAIQEAFRRRPDSAAACQDHIGIRNLHERIRLLCGTAYGLSITSERGSFTEVKIRLPLRRGVQDALQNPPRR